MVAAFNCHPVWGGRGASGDSSPRSLNSGSSLSGIALTFPFGSRGSVVGKAEVSERISRARRKVVRQFDLERV